MRLHHPLVALCAIFAAANIGIATFIAAAPAPRAIVTIAATSDDLPTPTPTPTPAPAPTTPTPQPLPSTRCDASLIVTTSANLPIGIQVPGAMKEIGRFGLSYTAPEGCPTRPTDEAVIREVTAAFQWSELSTIASRRAAITQLGLWNVDRSVKYGSVSSVRATSTINPGRFLIGSRRLTIPINGTKEIVILGNTTNVTGRNTGSVNLSTHITKVIAELTMSENATVGTLTYDGAPVAQQTTITAGLDSGSPSGIQTAGAGKEILRFWVTATGGEATIQKVQLQFEATRDEQTIRAPLRDISISLQPEGSPRIGRWQIPSSGKLTIANINRFLGSTITAGQTKVIRVFANTTQAGHGQPPPSLRANLVDLVARTVDGNLINPTATMPVQGNWLSY